MRIKKSGEKGFSLVELAIVLVIIGIIMGAVLKGQDLINNARAKKVATWEKSWEIAQWQYFDRKGRFAGDATNKNGLIGDVGGEQTGTTNAGYEITNANFVNPPPLTISVGSYTFYMFMGYDPDVSKNVIAVCKDATCATVFASDELAFMEVIDTSLDGTADHGAGNVRSATTVTVTNSAVTAVTELAVSGDWAITDKALVYYFDRPR